MLTTIQNNPAVAAGIISVLLIMLGYFIKKVDRKIDTHSDMVGRIKLDITEQLLTMRNDIKDDIIVAFNTTCCERQGACKMLQEAKLQLVINTNTAICAKLTRLDEERRDAWTLQRRWNDKIETHVYKDGDHGGGR